MLQQVKIFGHFVSCVDLMQVAKGTLADPYHIFIIYKHLHSQYYKIIIYHSHFIRDVTACAT